MTQIYVAALPIAPDTLVVVSHRLRSYVGLSRDQLYLHHVRPTREDDPLVLDGKRTAGALTCDCRGGQVRGTCYWTERAEALEAAEPLAFAEPDWLRPRAALAAGSATFDAPAGAGDLQEAYRG